MSSTIREFIGEVLLSEKTKRELEPVVSDLGTKKKNVNVKAGSSLANRIEPTVVDMVKQAYAPIGGNPKIKDVGDVSHEYDDWVVADIDDDPEPDVFVAGNARNGGMKLGVSATDSSAQAKSWLMQLKSKLFKNKWWAEVSGAPAHIALNKLGVKSVDDEERVRKLLGGKDITWHGKHPEGKFPGTNGWYSRDIGGHQHAKIIVGDIG